MPRKQQLLKKVKQAKGFLSNLIKFGFYRKASNPLILNIDLISASLQVFTLPSKKLQISLYLKISFKIFGKM